MRIIVTRLGEVKGEKESFKSSARKRKRKRIVGLVLFVLCKFNEMSKT